MSSLPSALRRSKEAWAAVGKPERARAVRQGDNCVTVGYDGTYLLCVDHAIATDWRAIVPKKPKAAGWPRYVMGCGDSGVFIHTGPGDADFYDRNGGVEHKVRPMNFHNGSLTESDPTRRNITAHDAAMWLYEHGHTEAAREIEVITETVECVYPGDWWANGEPIRFVAFGDRYTILKRSKARREACAKLDAAIREIGGVK